MNVLKSSERSPEPTLNQVSRFNYAVDFVNRIASPPQSPLFKAEFKQTEIFSTKGQGNLWIDPALCTEYALSHVSFMAQSLATYQKEVSSHKTVLLLHQLNDTKYLCTSRQISDGRLL
ncbi:hypothetical protein I7I51_04301 [Histoplasma capsulatum]|uniref:Uncharacterized protein n=1 Tax=Ajellomyces capsulatus TaxID=5037 RepID=A0A8A1MBX9_AJECA|nr:hypothetical protein I7I51_04301 [Histoplasma capsulatum]